MRVLYFDRSGFCMGEASRGGEVYRGLARVRTREMDWTTLKLLLEGIEPGKRRKRYRLAHNKKDGPTRCLRYNVWMSNATPKPLPSEAEMSSLTPAHWQEMMSSQAATIESLQQPLAWVYTRERRLGLEVFLEDPDVAMDTNHLERALRVIPMGRRNWLFTWTELGAKHVGIIQSLLTTCCLYEISPYDYLVDVLQRVGVHPATRVTELTPRLWKQQFASSPLRSDLHHTIETGRYR
jgi:Transposase IS66 family/IS66 C-terminal element